jgi:hypothetical protein
MTQTELPEVGETVGVARTDLSQLWGARSGRGGQNQERSGEGCDVIGTTLICGKPAPLITREGGFPTLRPLALARQCVAVGREAHGRGRGLPMRGVSLSVGGERRRGLGNCVGRRREYGNWLRLGVAAKRGEGCHLSQIER